MNKIGLYAIIIITFASASLASEFTPVPLSSNDVIEVRQQLDQYGNGNVTLNDLTQDGTTDFDQKLVSYYLSHPNSVTVKMKLPISRCFAAFGKYQEAAKLAANYVQAYPNDWHGWRILGGANFIMMNYIAAVSAYTNAVRLGDDGSYVPLTAAAMKSGQLEIVHSLLPRLFALKQARSSKIQPLEVVGVLLIYSLRTDQQGIFVKALAGVTGQQILSRDDLHQLVMAGCKRFKGEAIDKIRQEVEEAAAGASSSAATNTPSP